MRSASRVLIASTLALAACATPLPKMDIKLSTPAELCAGASSQSTALCMPVARLERLLKQGELNVLQARSTSSGTAGAMVLWLEFPKEHLILKAKWKEAARGGSALNNEPRKELAAYELQKLFLEPDEYVVPPTESRCIPLDLYAMEIRPAQPTFPGTHCAFGALSFWVEGIRELGDVDKKRFETDLRYRATVANLNLFAYLLDHRDTRPANFAITKNVDHPRAFSIDNGLALAGLVNPRTTFRHMWNHVIVPKVPHDKIDRLRKITRQDLDKLMTVAEFSINGMQLDEIPITDAFDGKDGVRQKDNVVQLGLKRSEIDDIEARIKKLLQLVDSGQLEQY